MILYQLAKSYEERTLLEEMASGSDEEGALPDLLERLAQLDHLLGEQAARWLDEIHSLNPVSWFKPSE